MVEGFTQNSQMKIERYKERKTDKKWKRDWKIRLIEKKMKGFYGLF